MEKMTPRLILFPSFPFFFFFDSTFEYLLLRRLIETKDNFSYYSRKKIFIFPRRKNNTANIGEVVNYGIYKEEICIYTHLGDAFF